MTTIRHIAEAFTLALVTAMAVAFMGVLAVVAISTTVGVSTPATAIMAVKIIAALAGAVVAVQTLT